MRVKYQLGHFFRLKSATPRGPFFYSVQSAPGLGGIPEVCWKTSILLFSHWKFPVSDQPPNWFLNPFNGREIIEPDRNWWEIPDFDPDVGDIKLTWEISRFDWVVAYAQLARQGDKTYLVRLNNWLMDWCKHNPPYKGPNWKCGQEVSIRVIRLALAAIITDQVGKETPGLRDIVGLHLMRIEPTVQYAMAQDNNHGTSEAAALFIGGSWLMAMGDTKASRWVDLGRKLIENRASRLIGAMGSFSQYSLNYHRVMLDTFSIVEVWRNIHNLPLFSDVWYQKAESATRWLGNMVSPLNGDGPNVGANDGARLLQLANCPYRDYRPSVQLAMALFAKKSAYPPGPWDDALKWLRVEAPQGVELFQENYIAGDGGFAILRHDKICMVMMRFPNFKFRPSQSDALHIDLWVGGESVLPDAGSYSYNTEKHWFEYFGGSSSHNTIQFDDRDQMPRISRFLMTDWLRTNFMEPLTTDELTNYFGAGYTDWQKATHRRQIRLNRASLKVIDTIEGSFKKATMRWRFRDSDFELQRISGNVVSVIFKKSKLKQISVSSTVQIVDARISPGWESKHYFERTSLNVLEITVLNHAVLTTEINWYL